MAQEFTINSSAIETKINQLLPSQGGFGAGVDFSASTMVIPIVDLTESAEGSQLRVDLQSSFSLITSTSFNVNNATTTIINTTGFFRIFGKASTFTSGSGDACTISITDGTTTKVLLDTRLFVQYSAVGNGGTTDFDFIVKLEAGDSIVATSGSTSLSLIGVTRQLADLSGNLVNP